MLRIQGGNEDFSKNNVGAHGRAPLRKYYFVAHPGEYCAPDHVFPRAYNVPRKSTGGRTGRSAG